MSVNDADWDVDGEQEQSQVRILLDQYRMLVYTFGAAVLLALLGAVIDLVSGPLTESSKLAHQISGLLGATALALGICLVLVVALWGVLVVTNR